MFDSIDALDVTVYPHDGGSYETTRHFSPTWDLVEYEVRTMDNYEKPILWLLQNRDVGDGNCLALCGGSGIYHVQAADLGADWFQAVDPHGSEDQIDVWLSDQGFSTARKFTWPVERAVEMAHWYYEHGSMHPGYRWTNE